MKRVLLSLLLLGAAPAFGQEGGLQPVDGGQPAPRDVGGWIGDDTQPAQPAPAQPAPDGAPAGGGADPLAPGAAPAPAAADPAPAPVDPEEQRRRGRQIDKNYKAALDIYEDMDDPRHGVEMLERRIANNEKIVSDYRRRLAQSQEQRRTLQVDLFNRMFYLRQQKERGQLNQEAYDRLARQEERNYEERVAALKGEIDACQRELSQAQERLDSLRAEKRMIDAMMSKSGRRGSGAQAKAPIPAPKPGERVLTALEERLRQLDKFEVHSTMGGVHPRDVGIGQAPQ